MNLLEEMTRHIEVAWLIKMFGTYGYASLVVGALFEGPLVMAASGLLVKLGFFTFWPAYLALNIGDLVADVFWYRVGHKLGTLGAIQKYTKQGVSAQTLDRISNAFYKHQNIVLIASKLTCGFGFLAIPVIVAAGAYKISFRRFLVIYGVGGCVWTLVPMSVGFYFGTRYEHVETILGKAILLSTLLFVAGLCFRVLWPKFGQLLGRYVIPKK